MLTRAHAERIVFEGQRAAGLDLRLDGQPAQGRMSRGELILSAGAIGTPQLLQLSGVGPAALLAAARHPVLHDMPGVGENLQDHLQIRTAFRISGARTLNELAGEPVRQGADRAANMRCSRSGPMSMAPSQLGIFMRSDPRFATPNIEFHVQPLSLDRFGEPLHDFPAITVSVCNLQAGIARAGAHRLARCAGIIRRSRRII